MKVGLFSIYLGLFCNTMAYTVIYPFGSMMVQEFGIAEDRSSTGFWVGILAFGMMSGRVIASPFWGLFCDKIGRRPAALSGILSILIFSISFGLSPNFALALLSRIGLGLFSCVSIPCLVIVSELTNSDPTYMSYVGMSWQIGNIFGNIVGGYFPGLLFEDFTFLAPNVVISIVGLISFVLCFVFLKETLQPKSGLDLSYSTRNYWDLMKDRSIQILCVANLALFINIAGFHELLTLWCWADLKNGGFEMSTTEIGNLLAICAVLLIFLEVFVYNFLRKFMNILQITRLVSSFSAAIFLLVPLCLFFRYSDLGKYLVLGLACFLWWNCSFMMATNFSVFANNSVYVSERGKINALMIGFTSISRAVGPLLLGSVFQLSNNSTLPVLLKVGCPFMIMSFSSMLVFFSTLSKKFQLLMNPKEHNDEMLIGKP